MAWYRAAVMHTDNIKLFLKFNLANLKAAECELEAKAMKVLRYDMCKNMTNI